MMTIAGKTVPRPGTYGSPALNRSVHDPETPNKLLKLLARDEFSRTPIVPRQVRSLFRLNSGSIVPAVVFGSCNIWAKRHV